MSDSTPISQLADDAKDKVHQALDQAGHLADNARDSLSTVQDKLPEQFRFLNSGWWGIHLLAIPLIFTVGYMLGQKKG